MDFTELLRDVAGVTAGPGVDTLSVEAMEVLRQHGDTKALSRIAQDVTLSPEVLTELGRDEHAEVRTALIRNPSVPVATVVELVKKEKRNKVLEVALERVIQDRAASIQMVREVAGKVTSAKKTLGFAACADAKEVAVELLVRAFELAVKQPTDDVPLDLMTDRYERLVPVAREWLTTRSVEIAENPSKVSPSEVAVTLKIGIALIQSDRWEIPYRTKEVLQRLLTTSQAVLRLVAAGLLTVTQRQILCEELLEVRRRIDTKAGTEDFLTAETIVSVFAEGSAPSEPRGRAQQVRMRDLLGRLRLARESRDPRVLSDTADRVSVDDEPLTIQIAEELLSNPAFSLNEVYCFETYHIAHERITLGKVMDKRFPNPVSTPEEVSEIISLARTDFFRDCRKGDHVVDRPDLDYIFKTAREISSGSVSLLLYMLFARDTVPKEVLKHCTMREIEELGRTVIMRRVFNLLATEFGTDAAMWETCKALMTNFEGTVAELIVAVKELS